MRMSIAWAIRKTIQSITDYSPVQLVFNKDMVMQMHIIVNWQKIKNQSLVAEKRNNDQENKNRIAHQYQSGDPILIIHSRSDRSRQRKLSSPTEGQYYIQRCITMGR